MRLFRFFILIAYLSLYNTVVFATDNDKINSVKSASKRLLKGSIIDKHSGESLAGTSVYLSSENTITYSDFKGQFSIFGKYNSDVYLKIEAPGYQSKTVFLRDYNFEQPIELDSL